HAADPAEGAEPLAAQVVAAEEVQRPAARPDQGCIFRERRGAGRGVADHPEEGVQGRGVVGVFLGQLQTVRGTLLRLLPERLARLVYLVLKGLAAVAVVGFLIRLA